MLLINKQLLKLGKHSWGWIIAIVVTKLVILLSFMVVVSAVAKVLCFSKVREMPLVFPSLE